MNRIIKFLSSLLGRETKAMVTIATVSVTEMVAGKIRKAVEEILDPERREGGPSSFEIDLGEVVVHASYCMYGPTITLAVGREKIRLVDHGYWSAMELEVAEKVLRLLTPRQKEAVEKRVAMEVAQSVQWRKEEAERLVTEEEVAKRREQSLREFVG